jgi:hypothetical protein
MLETPSPAATEEGRGEGTRSAWAPSRKPRGLGRPFPSPCFGRERIAAVLPALLVLPLAVFALAPLVAGPMFASADGLLHLYRLVEFDAALRSGILYPRWAPDLLAGYGYPIFIFYAPGLYYLAELFHLLGFGFADALKAAVAAGMLASGMGMYVLGRELWGRWGGLLAAVAYLYAPYRLVNTYLDGELAQTLAWAWLPWLIWACWRWLRTRRLGWGVLAAGCYAGLIATHSVSAWLTTLFLALGLGALLIVRGVRLVDALRLGGFLALGVGLAAPYWLPALAEQAYVQLDRVRIATYDFHTNLLPLNRTLSTSWAHQYSEYIGVNGPAQLGLAQALVAGLAAALLMALRRRAAGPGLLFVALAAIAFVLMLKPAAPVWETIPFGAFLQFPDRLLAVMAFCLALLAGSLALSLRRWAPLVAPAAVALLIYGAAAQLQVKFVALPAPLDRDDVAAYEQISGAFGTTAKGEFTPKWLGAPPLTSPMLHSVLTGELPVLSADGAEIEVLRREPEAMVAMVSAGQARQIELPVAYFPGWTGSVDGRPAAAEPGRHGLVAVDVPAGDARVELRFGASNDRRLADAVGLLSALALLGLLAWSVWPISPHSATGQGEGSGSESTPDGERPGASAGLPPRAAGLRLRNPLAGSSPSLAVAAAAAGGGLLVLALALAPGRLHLEGWPVQRPMLVGYAGWLQLMGADVALEGDRAKVSAVFRTGTAQSARLVRATVRLMTRETVWASSTQELSADGWISAVPRRVDFDLPLPAGLPSGAYELNVEIWMDNGIVGPESTVLSYGAPRVGKITLGPLTLTSPVSGEPAGEPPASADFGSLELRAWQPPLQAEQGQFIPISLWWRVRDAPNSDWGTSLHIVDGHGQTWAGHDDQPRLGYNPTSQWRAGDLQHDVQMALLPHGIPPGGYTVLAGWYDARSGAPVGPQNVPIGRIDVMPASNPDERLLEVPHRLKQAFPQGLELLGYELPSSCVVAGQAVPLRLFWRTDRQPGTDLGVTVSFDGHEQTLALPSTSRWRPGQLMETRLSVPTEADWAASGRLRVALDGTGPVELPDTLTLEPTPRLSALPPGLKRAEPDTLAGTARLAGYHQELAGGKLRLTLYWQALGPVPPNLKVFTHLLDARNQVVAQHDGPPAAGKRPTGSWSTGEYIEDSHELNLPTGPGPWQLEVGLYDAAGGQRLGDRLLLGTVPG